jgi:tetratricopeptide (TPR) repeat protein
MFAKSISFRRWLHLSILFLVAGLGIGHSQDEAVDDIKYNDDYERVHKIAAVTQPLKRAEQLVALFAERKDLHEKLRPYVADLFVRDLDALSKQQNFAAIKSLSERAIKANPKFGEAYLYYGLAMRQDHKLDEAVNAFAKCFVIPNPYQLRAKPLLDAAYRAQNKGSLVGEDKMLNALKKEMK